MTSLRFGLVWILKIFFAIFNCAFSTMIPDIDIGTTRPCKVSILHCCSSNYVITAIVVWLT